ncbi:hypothetical protein HU200_002932 [Digitaria exilis]|uniref:Uncharacterized protein n=1 Tax=Digitaria exilis TaxID=1010633 RepID=A0A835FXI2_9POAL|nr:hypothetical protein HU200_002932 [Digitaria exilis]
MLIARCIWKERNDRTFERRPTNNVNQLIHICSEGQLWAQAGAKWMAVVGWPEALLVA